MFIQNVRTNYLHPIQTLLYNSIHFVRVLILVLICIFMLKHENKTAFLERPHFSLTSIEMPNVKGILDQKVVATVRAN